MKRRVLLGALAVLLAIAETLGAVQAQGTQVHGVQALLEQVQQASKAGTKARAARVQRFEKQRNAQARLLKKASKQQAAAQARADAIRKEFKKNQKQIQLLQQKLRDSLGDRGALYNAVHDAAHHFAHIASDSLVSAQYSQAPAKLKKLAAADHVPSLGDIRELWFLMQQIITANGQVARFPARIAGQSGRPQQAMVTRVGPFTAFTEGKYLALVPGTTQLSVLVHQPGHLNAARDFSTTQAAVAPILVDPSRGQLLRRQAQRPSLRDRIDQAGIIGRVIIAIGLLGAALAIYQFLYLWLVSFRVRRQLRYPDTPRSSNPLGRVLSCLDGGGQDTDTELLETRISEAVLHETPPLERFQGFLRMVVAAGPLLGLLGTVSGMIVIFQVMTEVGTGDPKLMAGGISQAMVSTVLGLLVAIPLLFVNSILSARSRVLVQILDEQSAGLLARRLETLRGR